MRLGKMVSIVLTVAAALAAGVAMAQGPSPEMARAKAAYRNIGGAAAVERARGYTSNYLQYSRAVPTVEPEVARDAADAIGDDITKAEKHFAWMRPKASKSGDKASLASLDVASNRHTNHSPSLPAPIRAAVQQDARPAGRPTARQVSDLRGSDPAPAGEGLNSESRGAHANIEDLRHRIDADEANLRTLRAQLQQRTDVYTGGLTEEQMRALD
jgi:hypothetical protein